jgi:hypothetical protein
MHCTYLLVLLAPTGSARRARPQFEVLPKSSYRDMLQASFDDGNGRTEWNKRNAASRAEGERAAARPGPAHHR